MKNYNNKKQNSCLLNDVHRVEINSSIFSHQHQIYQFEICQFSLIEIIYIKKKTKKLKKKKKREQKNKKKNPE